MRKHKFIIGSYYHIYNRGVDKRDIFSDTKDPPRFVLCMKLFSYKNPIGSVQVALRNKAVDIQRLQKDEKIVSIVEYCLNPNHFHMILREESENGISEFMKRLMGGYTKYFNDKYSRSGSLFQGRFKSSYAEREKYFEDLFAYVMWNYRVHDISKDKINLVKTSEDEYRSSVFDVIDKKEGKKFLEWFGGYKNFLRHAQKTISLIRKERGKFPNIDFNLDD
ncbi:MAG: transposase [bacterium]